GTIVQLTGSQLLPGRESDVDHVLAFDYPTFFTEYGDAVAAGPTCPPIHASCRRDLEQIGRHSTYRRIVGVYDLYRQSPHRIAARAGCANCKDEDRDASASSELTDAQQSSPACLWARDYFFV